MTNIKEASKILLNGIESTFVKHSFELNRNKREFKRSVGNCIQIFRLLFYKENSHLAVEPQISIKVLPIEDIYNRVSSVKGRPYHTLGNHLFEILRYVDNGEEIGKGASQDWLVENENHIEKLIKIIPEYLEETILPYFNENSSIEKVDELLNKYPRELSVHNYLYPLRANIAIIAAKLNKNPKYKELAEVYEEELQEAEETYKEDFVKLKEELKKTYENSQ